MTRVTVVFTPSIAIDGVPLTDHVTIESVPSFSITVPADSISVASTVRQEICDLADDLLASDAFELAVVALVRAGRGAA